MGLCLQDFFRGGLPLPSCESENMTPNIMLWASITKQGFAALCIAPLIFKVRYFIIPLFFSWWTFPTAMAARSQALCDHSGFLSQLFSEKMTMTLIRNRLGLLVLGVLVTFVLYLLLPAIQHERFTASVDLPKPRAMEEETRKSQGTGNITILIGRVLQNPSVFFREAAPVQKNGVPSSERLAVIFLHGQTFTSRTWEELGTLALLFENGYRAVAIDLPGYGESLQSNAVETAPSRVAFLQEVLKELGLQKPVLISSSMSGSYSIPFLLSSGDQLSGFVSISPVGTKEFTTQQYQQVKTPTLIIYGEHDTGLGTQSLQSLQQIPKSKVVMLPEAGHACYLDKPQEFHKALLNFLSELK